MLRRRYQSASWQPLFAQEPLCYMPAFITNSVYSNYVSGGPPQVPYEHLSAAVDAIASRREDAKRPTYTYLYVPFIDTAEHEHGPFAKQPAKVLAKVERDIAKLASRVGSRARIIVTADHGLTHVERAASIEIADGDPLLDLLASPPSGEPRVPLFYAHEGMAVAFAAAFRERFRNGTRCSPSMRWTRSGCSAPAARAETRRRLGDFMAISATPDAINYKPDAPMLGISRRPACPTRCGFR